MILMDPVVRGLSDSLPSTEEGLFPRLLARMRQERLAHALLRDRGADAAVLDELDLLVWPRDRAAFHRLARELGFVRCRRRIPLKDVYAAYAGDRVLFVDVHYAFVQGGIVYLPLPAERADGALTPTDELLHLCFHNLLGKGGLQAKHLPRIRELLAAGAGGEAVHARVPNRAVAAVLLRVLADPEAHAPGSAPAAGARTELRRRLLRRVDNCARDFWCRFLRDRLKRPRGTQIVFLGVDGAGKTTTIEKVSQRLRDTERVPFANVYMGPWGQFRTRLLHWAYARGFQPPEEDWLAKLGERLRGRGGEPVLKCLSKWLRGRVRGLGYYLAVYLDLWARYRKDVRPRLRRGELVLSDRYVYDLRYLYHSEPVHVFGLTRRLVCRLFPRPHLIFFLFHEPEAIAARKPQLQADAIRRLQDSYRRALRGLPVVEVRTDGPVDREVTARIVAAWYERR